VQIDELETACRDAAARIVEREGRPVPASVVLPLSGATRVVTLPEFPPDDADRFALLSEFAEDEMRPANAPCYGFVAEATAEGDSGPMEVVVVVYGARGHHPRVTAAPLDGTTIGPYADAEDLHPEALPFLAPLQHAADAATPPDVMGG
jgi:hypothetical protein